MRTYCTRLLPTETLPSARDAQTPLNAARTAIPQAMEIILARVERMPNRCSAHLSALGAESQVPPARYGSMGTEHGRTQTERIFDYEITRDLTACSLKS